MDSGKMSKKEEERNAKELEMLPKIKEIENEFKEIKTKKEYFTYLILGIFWKILQVCLKELPIQEATKLKILMFQKKYI